MGRGQLFSMDLVIGVLIFLLASGVIYSIFISKSQEDVATYRVQSEVIATKLTSESSLQVAPKNQLDMDAMAGLALSANTDYAELKEQLGVKDDFCIYLQDEEGNLIYITNDSGTRYPGIGSGSQDVQLTEWDIPCGVPCSSGQCT